MASALVLGLFALQEREPPFDRALLARAEEKLARGEPVQALDDLDALRARVPQRDLPLADAIAAEAAFAFGRASLARRIAERGLSAGADAVTVSRLLRVLVVATAESEEGPSSPEVRARLRATESARPAPIEALLDASLDLRLAEIHDRVSTGPRAGERAAREVLARAEAVPEEDLAPAAAMLCRAGSHLADGAHALEQGTRIARAHGRVADEAYCLISAGDLALHRGDFDRADAEYMHALTVLGDRPLPREQREAAFSRALVAERRGDFARAATFARAACVWVDRLLALETDFAAREAIFTNLLGYYVDVEKYSVLAGQTAAGIAAGEAGKARAYSALLRGTASIDETMGGTFLALRPETPASSDDDARALARFAASLGSTDVALAYTMLGHDRRGHFQLAIGVVTRASTSAVIVDQPETFRADLVDFARAIERNETERARMLGARLYAVLVAPVEGALLGKERLFVSPHLRLHGLSWGALFDGAHTLAERIAIARVPPLVVTEREPDDERGILASRQWLVAVDPRHAGLEPLPGFDPLVELLSGRLASATTLRADDVTEARLLDVLHHVDAFVYFGHARYDAARPLKSALLVAGSEQVEAARVLGLQHRLDVVMLIGCETSRQQGERTSYSDETIGLPRAFLAAGARHVIGALWPVVDRDAEDYVRALLRKEAEGMDVVRAAGAGARCLASGRCPSRGVAAWGGFVVDAR